MQYNSAQHNTKSLQTNNIYENDTLEVEDLLLRQIFELGTEAAVQNLWHVFRQALAELEGLSLVAFSLSLYWLY